MDSIRRAAWAVLASLRLGAAPVPDDAASLLAESRFEEAAAATSRRLAAAPLDAEARRVAGYLALLSLRHAEAAEHLERLVALRPEDLDAKQRLAEAYRCLDRHAEAIALYRAAGKEGLARQAEALAGKPVYRIAGETTEVTIPFVLTDPLPFINVRVNGGVGDEDALFLIDTGAGRTVVDPELAAKVGITSLGSDSSVFAGGKEATFELGVAKSLGLGALTLENVPVLMLSTARWSAAARGQRVWGVVGTHLLMRFLATIDYPRGALVLRARGSNVAAGGHSIPIWLGGDHLILARGALRGQAGLFLVDTGLAGAAFTGPRSILAAAGVELGGPSTEGVGGGGKVTVTPFAVEDLALGDVHDRELLGIAGAFPESLEHSQGYRIAGLVSHTFLRPYAVTFDFDGRRLVLAKP